MYLVLFCMYSSKEDSSLDIGDKTNEESFIGVKIEVTRLSIFCCLVYTHVPKKKWKRLYPLEPSERVVLPRDVAMIRKRPVLLLDTLQDVEKYAICIHSFHPFAFRL